MFNDPFSQAALDSRDQRQQLDRLLRTTAPHERIILAGIGLILLALVAWALFGSIVRGVTIDGVLIEPGPRREVVSAEPGHLVEILVAPGDRVEAGAPIARQSVPALDREVAALRERLAILQAESRQDGGGALRPRLVSALTTLLEMDARRSARELIVSPVAGEVMALPSAPGEYLPAGARVARIRDAGDRPPLAVLRVVPSAAQRIDPEMRAWVTFTTPDGTTHRVEGEVAAVTAGPLPGWLAAMRPAVADSLHRVDVTFRADAGLSVPDGAPCRVRIELGRHSPAALLGLGRS